MRKMEKVAVVAIGGNSLIKGTNQTIPDQIEATREICSHIAGIIDEGWKVIITHGNGPQIGFILLRSELSSHILHPVPLDFCGAHTQGALGYMIQQCMYNELKLRGIQRQIATIVTQITVRKNDPAFKNPTKPIGPFYEKDVAQKYEKERGWRMIEDSGRGWRRVVPSPMPLRIIEEKIIKTFVNQGIIIVAAGGGGIPVVNQEGNLKGVEAVIDKDLTTALLAAKIKVELLLISTTVEKVALNFGKPNQKLLGKITLTEAKKYYEEGHFPPGNMGPKIQAVIYYLENGGKEAIITNAESIERALHGLTGTHIVP